MKKAGWVLGILIFEIFFSICVEAQCANCHYVRAGATGNNDGSDWTNAFTSLPVNLQRGHTYYLADGNYESYTFDDAEIGESYIYVKKANLTEHGTNIGWQSSYGDGQARFDTGVNVPVFTFKNSYYNLDGGQGLMDGETYPYGFLSVVEDADIVGPGVAESSITIRADSGKSSPHNINLSHIEMRGAGVDTGTYPQCRNTNVYIIGELGDEIYQVNFINNYIHSSSSGFVLTSYIRDIKFDGNYFAKVRHPVCHNEAFAIHPNASNITISNNYFVDISGTGYLVFGLTNGGVFDNIDIFGNFFISSPDYPNPTIISDTNSPITNNLKVYQNTFSDIYTAGSYVTVMSFNINSSNILFYNNLLRNVGNSSGHVFGNNILHDYNLCYSSINKCNSNYLTQVADEVNGQVVTTDPVDSNFYPVFPTNPGKTDLGAQYGIDPRGNVRGTDGVLDRGAYEFIEGSLEGDLNGDGKITTEEVIKFNRGFSGSLWSRIIGVVKRWLFG